MSDDLKNIVGKNIKSQREKHGETSVQLSTILGVSQSTVSDWENGKKMPRVGAIEKMSDHWNINKTSLLNEQTQKNENMELLAAHIDDGVTEDQMDEILNYIDYIKNKYKKD